MYVGNMMSDSSSYYPNQRSSARLRELELDPRRQRVGSVALTDGFDAPTTEAPTDWNTTGIDGIEGRDYDVSVSGYRNYVHEMERKLSEENDSVHSLPRHDNSRRHRRESTRGSDAGASAYGAGRARKGSVGGYSLGEDAHLLDGQIADVQLIEHCVVEDGPERKITLWRERVAQQMGAPSETRSNASGLATKTRSHRKQRSNESPAGQGRTSGSSSSGKGKEKSLDSGYQRTEYIISYQQPPHMAGVSQQVYTASEAAAKSPRPRKNSSLTKVNTRAAMSPGPLSPSRPRANSGKSFERTEYIVNYLHTPPDSEHSSQKLRQNAPMSPTHAGNTYIPVDDTGLSRAATTSPIELILASCEPSLLHLNPVLCELGIFKMEHLRAIARLSEETRNRELKVPALQRGVTVMEWAILLDKILTL